MEPPRRVLIQIFSLYDEDCSGYLNASQFFNLVRTLLSFLHSKLLTLDCNEVVEESNRIANRIRIRLDNKIALDEFLAACERHPSPFKPFFGIMKVFFEESNFPLLNEIFPFTPTYEYQTLYDWQSVLPNCESILPLSDTTARTSSGGTRRTSEHPLSCYGTKKARISEECQFSLRIARPALLDPVRVRLRRDETVGDVLSKAVQAWPLHHRPAPPSSSLYLVYRRPITAPTRPRSHSDQQDPPEQWEEVVLPPSATVEQVSLFFCHRECEIHHEPFFSRSTFPAPPSASCSDVGADGDSPPRPPHASRSQHHQPHAPRQHASQQPSSYNHNHHHHHHHRDEHGRQQQQQQRQEEQQKEQQEQPQPQHQHQQPQQQPPQHTTSAQLLVARLGDDFSRIRVQMQQETRHLAHLLPVWEDSLTLLRDQLPPADTSWEDGSVLSAVDREDLGVQAGALREDLRAMQRCLESLHWHASK